MNKIPVFLDTDIGSDIDDTWALGLLLKSPEVKLALALSAVGDVRYKAKILAKMLEIGGSSDATVGLGIQAATWSDPQLKNLHKRQAAWVEDYSLADYPGTVREDGIEALIEGIMHSKDTPKLLCLGPLPNIARALELEPRIAPKCDFIGIHGSVRLGYFGSPTPAAEYNVQYNPAAVRRVFSAPWKSALISPLDTCGYIALFGPLYQRVLNSKYPVAAAIIENYRNWRHDEAQHWKTRSSLLCDTVAAYLAFDESLVEIETLPISVTDNGFTKIDPEHGQPLRVASGWKDFHAFEKLLVDRLTTAN